MNGLALEIDRILDHARTLRVTIITDDDVAEPVERRAWLAAKFEVLIDIEANLIDANFAQRDFRSGARNEAQERRHVGASLVPRQFAAGQVSQANRTAAFAFGATWSCMRRVATRRLRIAARVGWWANRVGNAWSIEAGWIGWIEVAEAP